jgi:tetratricopeptide (TPR) repeat protein
MSKKIILFIIFFFISFKAISKEKLDYFNMGKKKYKLKEFEKSKFYFEKDIVRNPKNEESYLYLAKIYITKKEYNEVEKNLNAILLLSPKNEEALYLLIKKKIEDGDYSIAKKKLDFFTSYCQKMCNKDKELSKLIKNSNLE